MKSRTEAARFIERQFNLRSDTKRNKGHKHHYGMQEVSDLMDFIYGDIKHDDEYIKHPYAKYMK